VTLSMKPPSPFTAAVVQAASVAFDSARTLEKLRVLASEAASGGAKLVVFPEAFVSGYPSGSDFGTRVGIRSADGRDLFRRYFDSAIDVPGPATQFIGDVASDNGIFLVVGVIERDGGTLYCTVLFFGPSGDLLGKHRKLMPTGMERLIWGFGDGSTLPVIESELGKIGAVICWENYMPLLRMAMYAKGVQIYCAPTADGRTTWLPTMQHVALEGRCFVLSCNQFSRRSDFPVEFDAIQGNEPDTVISRGGSCIISPLGEVLAGPNFDEETILTAEIDLAEITRGKFDFDAAGHYARPDIFRLYVNEQAMPVVVPTTAEFSESENARTPELPPRPS